MSDRIFHVLDAVPGKHRAPMGFRVGIILIQNALVGSDCLVKLILTAEVIGPVVQVQLLFVRHPGKGHDAAAMVAGPGGFVLAQQDIPAAHFTFQNSHLPYPLIYPQFPCAPKQIPCIKPRFRFLFCPYPLRPGRFPPAYPSAAGAKSPWIPVRNGAAG